MSDIRAAVIAGPGSAPTIQMLDQPRVGRRAALYAIGACGVSDADLALLRGEGRPDLAWPLTPGQEAAGVLEEMGPDLTEDCLGAPLRVGAKILVPAFAPCLRCPVCLHHPAQATRCLHPVQLRGGWADRGHTDFAAHPGARLYRLPDDMPLWLATLTAPFATAQRALRRAQDIGRFPPGAFARLCRQFGAEATIGADTPAETVEIVRETVGGLGVDLVLSFRVAVADSLAMLRDGGSCVDLGPGAGGMPSDVATRDLILIGSAGHAPADLPGAVRMLHRAQGRYPFLKMLSRHPLTTAGIVEATGSSAPKAVLVGNPDIIGP
jgi:D-arabinose 1-dehydrogenase-like Zn-dependent alcohol dehydrogenase